MLPSSAASAHSPHCGPHHREASSGHLVLGALRQLVPLSVTGTLIPPKTSPLLLHLMTPSPVDTGFKMSPSQFIPCSSGPQSSVGGERVAQTQQATLMLPTATRLTQGHPAIDTGCQPHCSPETPRCSGRPSAHSPKAQSAARILRAAFTSAGLGRGIPD